MDSHSEAAPDYADVIEGVITTIPLDRLMLSSLNVRQTERAADVDSLAEDIGARGLKQNLVVIPAHFMTGEPTHEHMAGEPNASGGKNVWDGRFEVIAGGRRYQAMQLLVQQERLSATFPVPCMIEYRDAASETSLSENLHRVAMNPADEFEAFRVIVDQARKNGSAEDPIAYCAKRFGVTVKHVNGRLRLASLAPEILEALRGNEIGVESAKAYAGVEDHALQLKVFSDQAKSSWKTHDPRAVRDALRGVTVPLDDPRVIYVGIIAYREAGGRIEAEMFMGTDGVERVIDVKLLDKLVKEKAAGEITAAAKKDGFKSGLFATGTGWSVKWPAEPKDMVRARDYGNVVLTKAEKKKAIALYAIATDGSALTLAGRFKPAEKSVAAPAPARDWEAEQRAQEREDKIVQRATALSLDAEMVVIGGDKLVIWPDHYFDLIEQDDDGEHLLVGVQLRVKRSDLDLHRLEAARLVDEEFAAELANQKLDDQQDGDREFESDEVEAG